MEQKENKKAQKLLGILDILICLLLFIAALYKGEFYVEDSLFINMIVCMLGLVCLSIKLILNIRDNKKITKSKIGTFLDICVILMPVSYFLPVIFKKYASLESAIFESIRYVNFAIIYFIARTSNNKKIYLNSLMIIGVVLALFGIDEITYRYLEPILNKISVYYLEKTSIRISSTLQYANITALMMLLANIISQDKIIKNISKVKENVNCTVKVIFELSIIILLQSAIILTTSRMNIFLMVLTTIAYSIFTYKQGKKKKSLVLPLLLLSSIILVTSIDRYLIMENYFMILFTYLLTFVVISILVTLSYRCKSHIIDEKVKDKFKKITTKKGLNIFFAVLVIIIVCAIITVPCKLVVESNSESEVTVSRSIFTNIKEKMKFSIDVDAKEDANFNISIYEFDKEFNRKLLTNIRAAYFKNGKFEKDLNISDDTIKLEFRVNVTNSKVTINSLMLDDKNINLSYMFIPDTIVFRLIDTLNQDSNNSLRYTYYTDSIKLFKFSPVFGLGGEGFKFRYQEVQSESYISSEAHSVPLQILVESGMVGLTIYIAINVLIYIALYRIIKNKNENGYMLILVFFCFNIVSLFDLVLSYGIMINVFGVIVGLIIGEYKKNNIKENDKYLLDNKSILGMTKIVVLSISLMTLFIVTLYSVNIYRASMFVLKDKEDDINISYERVGVFENKVKLDKYNASYLTNLIAEYDSHIDILNELYLKTTDSEIKGKIKKEIDNYVIKQKEVADNLIEYEYYNKYAIEKVARCYFKRYIAYARLYSDNFKNENIAFVFYVGYAIKLTDRLTIIGKNNETAIKFAHDIYSEFLPNLKMQNKIINSPMLNEAIQDMNTKLNYLKKISN